MRDEEKEKEEEGERDWEESVRGSRRNRTGGEQETEKSKCTQNEKMIRFMRSEATKFVAALKNPSLLHLMGTRRGL